ncbi:MAG: circularly permuted type 2 ATP-grasp protein [Gammaproteobacteria bacterium]|uniref:circularly permuted type 2 ATP-grasp protein n=1 Tax=Pseudomaricurvus alcaniphilus TaxID=1166482 RepID=UPI0014084E2A|nr:circularly permuted type 2 ATP-grasp protein [Pseudomaricurvus alcaniphilus]MBR9909580.1 circularly permuted type 2 ATP-grasp protein [Gammaproteobacteria bacterium]NHN37004.1 circularly permuted type 2 ATP-grasp protein [Pseudomaricurvus alcaniphilus]
MTTAWNDYQSGEFYDELIGPNGNARKPAQKLVSYLKSLTDEEVSSRKLAAELAIKDMGISFTVYTDEGNIDRAWPFDIIPRVISKTQWDKTDAGLKQRLQALNMFIDDLYNGQKIIKDGVIPEYVLKQSTNYRKECEGISPAYGVWAHICGTDLVRDKDGEFYVLEDNLRVPSGVSYMLENRSIMKRVLPDVFEKVDIAPIEAYTSHLFETLTSLSPRKIRKPVVAVLTPGIYNSAYFEHAFLAQKMGAELVQGSDLVVQDDDCVYMKTIAGLERVDVIYRRIDDLFLDPEAFRKDSALGVTGLMRAWKAGNVALANAPGAGVADDKVVYAYVPEVIKYYLGEDPLLPNVETFLCYDKKQRDYVLANLDKLVVKPANESGGYGMLIGPHSTKKERETFAELIKAKPRNYIAQPTLALSTAPTFTEKGNTPEPRHLDLRPFVLQAKDSYVTTGGLTRVALKKGSLVVNSSQGGGSKDTWIVDTHPEAKA